jgi:cysteine desulfurase
VVYFDHAATTIIYPEVLAILQKSFSEDFANPSSSHSLGSELQKRIEDAKTVFLKTLNASPEDSFFFTGSATESNNTVIAGLPLSSGDIVLYSPADHPSITEPVLKLKEKGVEIIPLKLLKTGAGYSTIEIE